MSEDHERVLQLARRARDLSDGPAWQRNVEDAAEAHAEACEAVWEELYRQIDNRDAEGMPVAKMKMPPDPRKEIKKQIIARLKTELPDMVSHIIDEY